MYQVIHFVSLTANLGMGEFRYGTKAYFDWYDIKY